MNGAGLRPLLAALCVLALRSPALCQIDAVALQDLRRSLPKANAVHCILFSSIGPSYEAYSVDPASGDWVEIRLGVARARLGGTLYEEVGESLHAKLTSSIPHNYYTERRIFPFAWVGRVLSSGSLVAVTRESDGYMVEYSESRGLPKGTSHLVRMHLDSRGALVSYQNEGMKEAHVIRYIHELPSGLKIGSPVFGDWTVHSAFELAPRSSMTPEWFHRHFADVRKLQSEARMDLARETNAGPEGNGAVPTDGVRLGRVAPRSGPVVATGILLVVLGGWLWRRSR